MLLVTLCYRNRRLGPAPMQQIKLTSVINIIIFNVCGSNIFESPFLYQNKYEFILLFLILLLLLFYFFYLIRLKRQIKKENFNDYNQ